MNTRRVASPDTDIILLRTKLNRPRVSGDFVARPRLAEKLNAGLTRKLTLISAPAGFGKSTLAASWFHSLESRVPPHSPVKCAWLSCDESDNNLVQFLSYVIAATRTVFPRALERTAALLEAPALPPVEYLANVVLDEIAALAGEFILALDDYHAIRNGDIQRLVETILLGLPACAHLFVITRRDPPFALARLRVQQQLIEVRAADLRFQLGEVGQFMRNILGQPLAKDALAQLENETEGWAAALRLAAISMQESEQPESVVAMLAAARRPAMEFLAEQVLSQQTDDVRDFLLRSSILDRMRGELCDAVLCDDAEQGGLCGRDGLERLERSNMFLIPLDGEGLWYRYHHLFRDLLRLNLQRSSEPVEIAALHHRAATWFAANGLPEEAIRHFLLAQDVESAATTAERHVFEMLNAEGLRAVQQLLDLLPEAALASRPGLLIAQCWVFVFQWRLEPVGFLLEQAEAAFARAGDMDGTQRAQLRGHIDAIASFYGFFAQDDPERSAVGALAALERVRPSGPHVYGNTMLTLALSLNRLGRRAEALERLHEELGQTRQGDFAVQIRNLIAMSAIHLYAANLERLGDCASSMLELANARKRRNSISFARYFLGCRHLLQGNAGAAAEHFQGVLALRYLANAKIYQDSLHGLALARQALGDAAGAVEAAQGALTIGIESMRPADVAESRSILTRLALLRGEDPLTLPLAEPPPAFQWNGYIEMPALTHARLLIARGTPTDLATAAAYLARAQEANRAAYDDRRVVETLVLEAVLNWRLGRKEVARDKAREALALAEPGNYAWPFIEDGANFKAILAGSPGGLASGFATRLLSQLRVAARPPQKRATVRRQGEELLETLTNREEEVLRLLAQRMTDREIAEALTISPLTAHKHVSNILAKLQVDSRRQAGLKARALGLVPAD